MASNPSALAAIASAPTAVYNPNLPYVTPEMFGAVGDGVTDDFAAFRAAIDFLEAIPHDNLRLSGGGQIRLSNKAYAISAQLDILGDNISIVGGGPGVSKFIPLTPNMTCVVVSSSYTELSNFSFYNPYQVSGCTALRYGPINPLDTTSYLHQLKNITRNLNYYAFAKGRVLLPGPNVSGKLSQISFSGFYDEVFQDCITAVEYLPSINANPGGADYNQTFNISVWSTSNVVNNAIAIYQGAHNNFFGGYILGVSNGTSPFTVPTAIYIGPAVWYDNFNNKFYGITTEYCTRSLENHTSFTEIYGGSLVTNNLLPAFPGIWEHTTSSAQPVLLSGAVGYQGGGSPIPPNWDLTATMLTGIGGAKLIQGAFYSLRADNPSVSPGGTFTITIPTVGPSYLLSVSSNANSTLPALYCTGSDGSTNVGALTPIVAGSCTVSQNASVLTITNSSGLTADMHATLMQVSF